MFASQIFFYHPHLPFNNFFLDTHKTIFCSSSFVFLQTLFFISISPLFYFCYIFIFFFLVWQDDFIQQWIFILTYTIVSINIFAIILYASMLSFCIHLSCYNDCLNIPIFLDFYDVILYICANKFFWWCLCVCLCGCIEDVLWRI